MAYRVGRYEGGKFVHAFDIERRDDGGVRFTNIERLSDQERTIVMAHFGRERFGRVSAGTEQHIRKFVPGSNHHFEYAVHEMPEPFALMRRK